MASSTFEAFAVNLPSGQAVSARHYPAPAASAPGIVLGHGAGAPQTSPFMVEIAERLTARGTHVFTFNFLYMELGRKVPDNNDRLESCFATVVEAARTRLSSENRGMFVGGKSMGGRIATQLVAKSEQARDRYRGIVVLGYPLHPPGRPEMLRTGHLPQLSVPLLVVQGSRDAFGSPDELREAFAQVPAPWEVFVVPDGDHSFKVPAKAAIGKGEILKQILDEIAFWMGL